MGRAYGFLRIILRKYDGAICNIEQPLDPPCPPREYIPVVLHYNIALVRIIYYWHGNCIMLCYTIMNWCNALSRYTPHHIDCIPLLLLGYIVTVLSHDLTIYLVVYSIYIMVRIRICILVYMVCFI